MNIHPYLASLYGRERQRDMMACADRQRLVRQLRDPAGASRRARPTALRPRRTWRTVPSPLARLLPRYRAAP